MRLTDGKKIADLQIDAWWFPHWIYDVSFDIFFDIDLEYDPEKEAYVVEDLDLFIDKIREGLAERESALENQHAPFITINPIRLRLNVEEVEQ